MQKAPRAGFAWKLKKKPFGFNFAKNEIEGKSIP